ncbi:MULTISPECIES: precorrin-3B synthase [Nocardia]|uniref:Ferredoxin-nitrite reductase n=1 Tax=Nocardia farcinica TaxID=37329 RepID=A0A0H5NHX5_NOCFR|nr:MULTISPECIES: precorrin-3B synthase [Nocardia]AXK84440.1 precorrin-3B synthase [Nocardia farcinica]MBF6069716.1 precorrin-3B synthase [Nocardia farcinica]MBF6183796.1 precorrin-3B synthase [Nocardia farcinica]MBF6249103.1 precorrin-3B synthase [Nocardia farcinica]MBF6257422.1 precorrin-3B synthase [Nocardia farcinica]
MTRTAPDACPGVLRLHQAADGPLARVRIPGGLLTPDQLRGLAEAATELGDGALELTSRGNVQLRRVRDAAELTARLEAAGLLPSHSHERVRNIVASPLAGRTGGTGAVHPLVAALDARLLADPALASLPGRVLFTLDDGRGAISALGGDIGVQAVTDEFALLLAGADTGIRLAATDAVDVMIAAAHAFLALSSGQWRLHEIPDGAARVVDRLGLSPTDDRVEPAPPAAPPIGWLPQDDGLVALGAGVALGSLPARTAEFLVAVERPVVLTPWRGLVVTDLDEWTAEQVVRVLAPMGLIFDANSPWLLVSACAGRPGCAKSHTDVRADVAAAVAEGRVPGPGEPTTLAAGPRAADQLAVAGRQHWSGCDRRCGRPRGPVVEVTAAADGYHVTGPA